MKSAAQLGLILLLAPVLLPAQAKTKHTVPAVFDNARYAWVESMDGDAFQPGLLPEDRQAIFDVESAIRHWNRYALTISRHEADLVFIIRKGRLATANVVVGIGGPQLTPGSGQSPPASTTGRGTTVGTGADVGPRDDMLEVHMLNPDGSLGTIVWQRLLHDGLDAPDVELIAELRKAVEKDYPQRPPAKP